jgi:hypothetical protein
MGESVVFNTSAKFIDVSHRVYIDICQFSPSPTITGESVPNTLHATAMLFMTYCCLSDTFIFIHCLPTFAFVYFVCIQTAGQYNHHEHLALQREEMLPVVRCPFEEFEVRLLCRCMSSCAP